MGIEGSRIDYKVVPQPSDGTWVNFRAWNISTVNPILELHQARHLAENDRPLAFKVELFRPCNWEVYLKTKDLKN